MSRDEKSEYKLTSNDYLRIGSVFHSMYALASRLCPRGKSSGIQFLECDSYVMRCYQSPTGTMFLVFAEPHSNIDLEQFLSEVYSLYSDYALKNPFYEVEQPLFNSCDKFVYHLERLVSTLNGNRP